MSTISVPNVQLQNISLCSVISVVKKARFGFIASRNNYPISFLLKKYTASATSPAI